MDYEKKYKEALTKSKEFYEKCKKCGAKITEEFLKNAFPELAESEDERIRKDLINYFHGQALEHTEEEVIDWLEKQAEQKPVVVDFNAKDWYVSKVDGKLHNIYYSVDKVEPKFKVGDVMRTLQEASDRTVDGMPVIISIDKEYYHCTNELIAITDQDDYEYPPMNRTQKPAAWSDEDEENLQHCCMAISTDGLHTYEDKRDMEAWLTSLKNRVQPQPKQEWSEEDEENLNKVIGVIERRGMISTVEQYKDILHTYICWLKSLKDRIGG